MGPAARLRAAVSGSAGAVGDPERGSMPARLAALALMRSSAALTRSSARLSVEAARNTSELATASCRLQQLCNRWSCGCWCAVEQSWLWRTSHPPPPFSSSPSLTFQQSASSRVISTPCQNIVSSKQLSTDLRRLTSAAFIARRVACSRTFSSSENAASESRRLTSCRGTADQRGGTTVRKVSGLPDRRDPFRAPARDADAGKSRTSFLLNVAPSCASLLQVCVRSDSSQQNHRPRRNLRSEVCEHGVRTIAHHRATQQGHHKWTDSPATRVGAWCVW